MKDRIKNLRKNFLKITQEEFAEQLSLSRNFIAQIECGAKIPSDRTISDICRIFDVDEVWLRTGEGDMLVQRSQDEKLAAFFGEVNLTDEGDFRKRFLSALSELDPDGWKVIEDLMKKCMNEENHE